jgi:hypothetical protein
VSSPYSICSVPFLPSREYPRAASGQREPSIHELDRSNSAIRDGLGSGPRWRRASPVSIASWRPPSQSTRCLNPDPAFWRRCPVCVQTWQLGKQPCQRCCLSQAVTQTLSGGTGVIRDGLTALRQALLATERPATVQAWMARPASRALLNELARGQRPLTHEILDQFPPGRSLAHLRAVLVAAGGLPPRDERMASLQRWITPSSANTATRGNERSWTSTPAGICCAGSADGSPMLAPAGNARRASGT